MSQYTYLNELLADESRAAGRRVFRLDADRWHSIMAQGFRSTAAPATLTLHLDVSNFNSPDVDEATGAPEEWLLDHVASLDLAAAAQGEIAIDPVVHLARWVRVRIEHTGIDTAYRIGVSAKGDAAGA
jgi:hypothetical protein